MLLKEWLLGILMEQDKSKETGSSIFWRHPCAFYGLVRLDDIMSDFGENQCGLITGSYNTCLMEAVRDKPNWYKCRLNTKEKKREIKEDMKNVRVFPREFCPSDGSPWKGFPLGVWIRHVMDNYT